jgi:malate permease and related proteins
MQNILLSFGFIILLGVAFRQLRPGGLEAAALTRAINVTVLNVFLPALCVRTLYVSRIDAEALLVPLSAGITVLTSLFLSVGVYHLLAKKMGLRPSETGVLVIGATFGNITYLGLPVLTGLYGTEAAKYALFYDLLSTTPLLWFVGVPVVAGYGEGRRPSLRESLRTVASLPPVWGILAGMVLNLLHVPFPRFVLNSLEMLGSLVVPLMVFSIGLALSLPEVRHAFAIVPAVIIKLVLVPLISCASAVLLGLDGRALASCVIEGAMPTMVLSLLIAAELKLDVSLAAFLIVVTTVLSFFTLQATVYFTEFLVH